MRSISGALRPIATAALSLAIVGCLSTTTPPKGSDPATETYAASLGVNIGQMTKMADALYIQDVVVGTGAVLAKGDSLSVRYTLWFVNGTQFASNVADTIPLFFRIGVGEVIVGWDLGLIGMHEGGKRRLIIGSDLAYGATGAGNCSVQQCIPGNTTLVFDIQMIAKYP